MTNVKNRDEPNNRQGRVYNIKCSNCQASYIGENGGLFGWGLVLLGCKIKGGMLPKFYLFLMFCFSKREMGAGVVGTQSNIPPPKTAVGETVA